MKFWFATLFITFSLGALGADNCFRRHIQEAIEINNIRKPIYASFYGGYSAEVSDRLIKMEQEMLLPARVIDRVAAGYQNKGLPILCVELQDMKLTPDLPENLPLEQTPIASDFVKLNVRKMQSELSANLSIGMEPFIKTVDRYLKQISVEPRLNCLSRHFLESVRVFAATNAQYRQKADPATLRSLTQFTKLIIKSHIYYLRESHDIDELALQIQIGGLPIICQDVPPIPVH